MALFGPRGTRAYSFVCNSEDMGRVLAIPGVIVSGHCTVKTPVDAAWSVASILGKPDPTKFGSADGPPAGMERYAKLGFRSKDVLRDYQRDGVAWLVAHPGGMLCDDMRLGKSLQAIAASVALGSKITLVLGPATVRPVWRDELFKWVPDCTVVTLHGRGADELRVWCRNCQGRQLSDGTKCKLCPRGQGCEIVHGKEECAKRLATLPDYTYVFVNYDLLLPQRNSDDRGKVSSRDDLPGWAPALAGVKFGNAIVDESHLLRGFNPDRNKAGLSKRERVRMVCAAIPYVWLLTGTPAYGFFRDTWAQLDIASGGLFGPTPYQFHARYCEGAKNEYGWKADGYGPFHGEIERRLEFWVLKRTREQVHAQLPPKIRQVIYVEGETSKVRKPLAANQIPRAQDIAKALAATCKAKMPAFVDNVMGEIAEGGKCVVFTNLRANAEMAYAELQSAFTSREHSAKVRQVNAIGWAVHGEQTPEMRAAAARAFREHKGAGVFIATIDSVQVGISLRGARSVHFVDLHWSPMALAQAEDRPYEPGTNGLTVVYYVVRDSVDEGVADVVVPKMRKLDAAFKSAQTKSMINSLTAEDEKLTVLEVMKRLTAHLTAPKEEGEVRDVRDW